MTELTLTVPLPFDAIERIYDQLAEAIDRAGPDNEAVFLTKLVLVMAHRAGHALDVESCIEAARGTVAFKPPSGSAAC